VANNESAPCTVAIVDDNDAVRDAISSLVRSCGYAALSFSSAAALLDAGPLPACCCIVSDLQMPGIGGLELQGLLRRAGSTAPLIVITAFPEASLRQRALDGGASAFLGKPFESHELMQCIGQALGRLLSCNGSTA
jgi:FixJ family two-component response regulator